MLPSRWSRCCIHPLAHKTTTLSSLCRVALIIWNAYQINSAECVSTMNSTVIIIFLEPILVCDQQTTLYYERLVLYTIALARHDINTLCLLNCKTWYEIGTHFSVIKFNIQSYIPILRTESAFTAHLILTWKENMENINESGYTS